MRLQLLAIGMGVMSSVLALPNSNLSNNFSPFQIQQTAVSGKVTGQNGEALAGVTVSVKGSSETALSDAKGNFSIRLPLGSSILVFSYTGMQTQEFNVKGKNNIAIQLTATGADMSEVVVIGYSSQKRNKITGAVGTISGDKLLERPVTNSGNLLQGRITGLQVTQPSGEPGRDNPGFLIRGRSTFGGSTAPLVLIDGVAGSINNLSPDDIENVTVLKDAASAAIYGARAANGVVLVTTKKGKKGQTSISYRINYARHTPTALPDLITNAADYMELYNAAAIRGGVAFKYPQAEIDKYRAGTDPAYKSFDNIDYYFNPANVTNHNLSLSGGTDKSIFNISLSYLNQEAMLPGYKFKRYNTLLNYTSQVNKIITVGTTMNLTYKDRMEPPFTSENISLLVYAAGPLYGPFLPDGSGRIISRAYDLEGRNRNVQEIYAMGNQNTKEYNLNAQAYIDIKLFKGLTWTNKFAINYTDEYYKMYQRPYKAYLLHDIDPATNDNKAASFGPDYLGVTDQYSKTLNPTLYSVLNYQTRIGNDHNVRALVGYEQLYNKFQTLRARRLNGVSTAITELAGYTNTGEAINATYPRLPGLSSPFEWALQSVFGSIGYDYKDKYLLETNMRYDGTSRVSPEYRWGFFPSVSAGWVISKEKFIADNHPIINNLKLRASYGTLGNQEIGNYPYQNVLTVSGISYPFGNTTPAQGAVLNSYKDQSLRWESSRTIDFGIDLDLRNNIFGVTFDWFRRNTFDILASQSVPASLGLTSPTFNNGRMQSKGIELEVRHQYQVGAFTYGLNGQLSTAKNKVLEIRVPAIGTSIAQVGLPYNSHNLYIWDGIFQTADLTDPKVPRHVLNPNPKAGDLKMKDINSDGVVDANDRMVVKGAYPDYIYSFGANASYKSFTFSAFFQGVEGLKNRVNNWGVDPFMQGAAPPAKWRNAWTPTNPTNALPAIYIAGYTGVAAYSGSTYYLMDASYLRLKNIVLSYTLPAKLLSRVRSKSMSVYVSADNLFTITNYEGSDPERASTTGNYAQYPQAKIFNIGANIKF